MKVFSPRLFDSIGTTMVVSHNLVVKGHLGDRGLSTDCAGRVTYAGNHSGFRISDRVVVISANSMAKTSIRVKAHQAAIMPDHLSFPEAAAMPTPVLLSYLALFNMAYLKGGETVLIYQGASCIGQMAIRLAQITGARVIATTRSSSKDSEKLLTAHLCVGDADVIDLNVSALVPTVSKVTNGRGVDVIVGALSGGTAVTTTEFEACLAPFGRLVDTTLRHVQHSTTGVSEQSDLRNTMNASICLGRLLQDQRFLLQGLFQQAMAMAFNHSLGSPQPLRVFSASEAGKAFHDLDGATSIGKRIIELNRAISIPVSPSSFKVYRLILTAL